MASRIAGASGTSSGPLSRNWLKVAPIVTVGSSRSNASIAAALLRSPNGRDRAGDRRYHRPPRAGGGGQVAAAATPRVFHRPGGRQRRERGGRLRVDAQDRR